MAERRQKNPVQILFSISSTELKYHKLLKALDPSQNNKTHNHDSINDYVDDNVNDL